MQVDSRHDNQARGIHSVLEGHIFLARAVNDNDRVHALSQARDFLFPDGLAVINLSDGEPVGDGEPIGPEPDDGQGPIDAPEQAAGTG